ERSPAAVIGHIGESPDITEPDRRTDSRKNKRGPPSEGFALRRHDQPFAYVSSRRRRCCPRHPNIDSIVKLLYLRHNLTTSESSRRPVARCRGMSGKVREVSGTAPQRIVYPGGHAGVPSIENLGEELGQLPGHDMRHTGLNGAGRELGRRNRHIRYRATGGVGYLGHRVTKRERPRPG